MYCKDQELQGLEWQELKSLQGSLKMFQQPRAQRPPVASQPRAFGPPVASQPEGTNTNAHRSILVSPNMKGQTASDFTGPCTYIIIFNYEGKLAIKFGWTKDFRTRIKQHEKVYQDLRIWSITRALKAQGGFATACKDGDIANNVEMMFKDKMDAYIFSIQLPENAEKQQTYTEILKNVTPELAEEQMEICSSEAYLRKEGLKAPGENVHKEARLLDANGHILEVMKMEQDNIRLEHDKIRLETDQIRMKNEGIQLEIQ